MNHRANVGRRELWRGALIALAFVLGATPAFAAASVTVQVEDDDGLHTSSGNAVYAARVQGTTNINLIVKNAKVSQPIQWPEVDGLPLTGSGYDPHTNSFLFILTPQRPGDFTVPAFDFRTDDGQTLHVGPLKFHAVP